MEPYAIAFFDIDGTLVQGNAWAGILRYSKVNRFKVFVLRVVDVPRVVMRKLYFLGQARYRAGWIRGLAGLMKGWHIDEIEILSDWIADDYLRPLYLMDVVKLLKAHQAEGTKIILVTSFFEETADKIAERLGADGIIATRLEFDEKGRATGNVKGNTSVGPRRVGFIKSYLERVGWQVSLADCIAYADSYTDAPMLAAMGAAVAVYPDKDLFAAATEQGWTIHPPDYTL